MTHLNPSSFSHALFRNVPRIAFALALATCAGHAQADDSSTAARAERAIIDAVGRGESPQALIEQWRAQNPAGAEAARRLQRSEGAVLKQALDDVRSALAANRGGRTNAEALDRAMENLRAADAQVTASFADAQKRLSESGATAEFHSRLRDAEARVRAPIDAMYEALGVAPPAQKSTATRIQDKAAIDRAAGILERLPAEQAAPILRATTLPVRPANLAARAPVLGPTVIPSYVTTAEVSPQAQDSAAGPEALFDDEILAKAKELGYDYVRIFEFVRNEVKTEWYAGSHKGATGVLRVKAGNDLDQASLLIALLRASGAPARYVQGVIELPVETLAKQMGLADAALVPDALGRAGIAFSPVAQGGRVALVRMEHVWVSALVPYTNYRGVVLDTTGRTWLPLDAWFKRLEGFATTSPLESLGLNSSTLAGEYLGADRDKDVLTFLRERAATVLPAGKTYAQVLGAARITAQRLDLLPNTLPYSVVAVTRESADIDPQLVVNVRLRLSSASTPSATAGLDTTFPLYRLVNDRVTLSYDAATVEDHRASLLWGGIDLTPAYLITLRPEIRIAGQTRSTGTAALTPGTSARFEVTFTGPVGTQSLEQTLTVGAYHALGFSSGDLSRSPNAPTGDPSRPPNAPAGDQEYDAARLLDGIAQSYVKTWKEAEDEFALLTRTAVMRPLPSLVMVNNYLRADAVANVTFAASWRGVTMDALTRTAEPIGTSTARADWMELSALQGSSLEQLTFTNLFKVDTVSADRVLALAGSRVSIDSGNMEAQLATLGHSAAVKDDIRNWVRQGLVVTTHSAPVTRKDWTGSAWVAKDPTSKAAGYFLSGKIAGGMSTPEAWPLQFLADALANPHGGVGEEEDNDPLAANSIALVGSTDGQKATVGQMLLNQLAVRVLSAKGKPVKGAKVSFRSLRGGGSFLGGAASIEALTDASGFAQTSFTLGKLTSESPVFIKKNEGDKYAYRVGQNFIEASVDARNGTLRAEPFNAFAFPDEPVSITKNESFASGNVIAKDKYENPVANVSVEIGSSGASNNCTDPAGSPGPALIDEGYCAAGVYPCGSRTLTTKTDSFGVAFYRVIHDHTDGAVYSVTINAAGKTLSAAFFSGLSCNAGLNTIMMTSYHIRDEEGRNYGATKKGTQLVPSINHGLYIAKTNNVYTRVVGAGTASQSCEVKISPNRTLYPVGAVNWQVSVSSGGSAGPMQRSENTFRTFVTAGPAAATHAVHAIASFEVEGGSWDQNCAFTPSTVQIQEQMPPAGRPIFYGLDVKVDRIIPVVDLIIGIETPVDTDTNRLHLGADSRTLYPTQIDYSVLPLEYPLRSVRADVLVDDVATLQFGSSSRLNQSKILIERGYPFDISKRNQLQLVSSPFEVKSDIVDLPFRQPLITAVRFDSGPGGESTGQPSADAGGGSGSGSGPGSSNIASGIGDKFRLTTDVDLTNGRMCRIGATYVFTLAQAATITLTAQPVGDNGQPAGTEEKLIDNRDYEKGDNNYQLDPAQFLPRKNGYLLTLKAVSKIDPSLSQTNISEMLVIFNTHDALPVGQVLVKGVNVKSGRLVLPGQSIQANGRGPALTFRPTYSSAGNGRLGSLGANWSHNYEAGLSITQCGDVIVSAGDSGTIRFHPGPNGTLVPGKGYHGTLIANNTDQSFDFYSKDGTHYHFIFVPPAKRWFLSRIADTNGNTLKLAYNMASVEGQLLTVTDAGGRTLVFTYQSFSLKQRGQAALITKVLGPEGMGLEFAYDDFGNLIESTRIDAPEASETYAYSVEAGLRFANLLTGHSNANGQVTSYAYNIGTADYFLSSGSAAATNITLPDSKVTSVTAADGGKTSFSYVPGVQGTSTPVTTVTDAKSNDSIYTLDRYGSPLTIRTPAGTTTTEWETGDIVMKSRTDANGVKTSYTHDAHGNVLTETVVGDGVNVTSSNTWLVQTAPPYISNRPLTHADRRGATTSYVYDTAGNLTAENRPEAVNLSYTYAANGDKLSATDGRNGVTKFAYDGNGNLERATDPMGGVVTTKHDARGRLTSIIDQEGRVTEMQYDALDHLVQHVDAAGGKRISTFDVLGNKLSEIDEAGRLTRYEYDPVNRPTKITNPVASKTIGYDKAGNKVSESDWAGNITTYAYDGANRLTTRTEPQSKTTHYSYDGVGNIKTETDALNRVTSHDYDGLNRRIKTTDADNGVSTMKYDGNGNKTEATDAETRLAKYEFDNLNRLTKATADSTGIAAVTAYSYDGNGNVLAVTDANGKITQHEYDANNRKTKTIDALGSITSVVYDKVGNKLQEFNARNFARSWTYDLLNRVTLAQDEARQQTSYEYDKVGNRTSETLPNGNRLVHTFDALNRRTSSRDNLGSVSATSYDGQGNALSQTDANGNVATHTYDSLNRKTGSQLPSAAGARTLTFGYDLVGNLTSERDANDNTATHIYDQLNRRTSTSDSIGTGFRATYDKVGNMASETDANGNIDTHVYDGLNRRTRTTDSRGVFMQASYDKAGNKVSNKDANGIETRTSFDALNRPTSVTRDSVLMVTNEYDAVGNLRFVTDARGNKVGYEYDPRNLMTKDNRALGVINSYTRDTMGDITETLDPEGRTSVSSYDLRRRMLSSRNGALETTTFSYDANGNRTGVLKPKGNTQAFVYDTANRLVKVTTPAGSSHLGYDKHGNLVSRKDAKNHTTGYQYDARHRRTETTFADNARETQTFDGQGNLKTLTDALGVVATYIYDARHRETNKSYSASTDTLQSIATQYDGNGNVTQTKETYGTGGSATTRTHTRAYDSFNRLERETDPWGDVISHTYDAQGNRTATTAQGATSQYAFDALNRRTSVTTAGGAITTTYDRTHLPTQVAYPNGVTSTTSYDAALRVKDITHAKSGATLERTAYVYDTNGNRTQQTRTLAAGTETVNYQYDNDDWLKQTDTASSIGGSSTRTVVYALDAVGNRATEASTATGANAANQTYGKSFTLDSRDRITQIVATGANAGTTAFTYDANGNLTTKESGSALRRYVWNVRDRLVEVTANGVSLAKYKYNAEGMRDEIEGRRRTTWVNGFAYLDKTIANTLLAKYETQANGRSPAIAITASGNEYLQADALGSTTLSTAGDGSVNAVTTYDAFGNTVTQGATQNKFGYTGHEQDNDTGLIYFKARHYDPELGRFISADPYEGEPNAPVSWNSYLYANSNPLYYIDKDGYSVTSEVSDLVDAAAAGGKYYAGVVAGAGFGAGVALVDGFKELLESAGDAHAARHGNVEAMKRQVARGQGIAYAVANPPQVAIQAANQYKQYVKKEEAVARAEEAADNPFKAGFVRGKVVGEGLTYAVPAAATAGGVVKGGVAITKNWKAATNTAKNIDAGTVSKIENAASQPSGTGSRTAPKPADTTPIDITEGPKADRTGKPAAVPKTAVAEQGPKEPTMLYRTMKEGPDGKPEVGPSKRQLGAKMGGESPDIVPDVDGLVKPGTGGMSVTPNDPLGLPDLRRPIALGGKSKDTLFCIRSDCLGEGLTYRPDPVKPGTHGFVEPSSPMSPEAFQKAIADTIKNWTKK